MNDSLFSFGEKQNFNQKLRDGEGLNCPCCGRFAKIYRRRIGARMVISLRGLDGRGRGFHHYQDFIKGDQADFAKLRWWGLIEKGEKGGTWAITDLGRNFLAGEARVPQFVYEYDGKAQKFSEGLVYIDSCLAKFKKSEIMENA